MKRAAITLVCLALVAVGGAMTGAGRASGSAPANRQAAEADAASLLPLLALPQGAVESAAEPAGDSDRLAAPSQLPATPNLVDLHRWWVVPQSRAATIAFLEGSPPAGSKLTGGGQGGTGLAVRNGEHAVADVQKEWEVFSFAPVPGTLGRRSLVVTVTQLSDGSSGVRADAQAVWLTPRPASEVIPSGAHLMRVSVVSEIRANRSGQRPFAVTAFPRIASVVKLLNALPAAQPAVSSCPVDLGNRVRLVFYPRRAAAPLSIVTINPEGCGIVGVRIRGKGEPPLEGSGLLVSEVASAVGVPIHTRPPH